MIGCVTDIIDMWIVIAKIKDLFKEVVCFRGEVVGNHIVASQVFS
jgi:hypothetical protein